MSRQPARCCGCDAKSATGRPSRRAKPVTRFRAKVGLSSSNEPSSTTASMTVRLS